MKTLVAIVRDHSGSMGGLRSGAIADYNECVQALKTGAAAAKDKTSVTIVEFDTIVQVLNPQGDPVTSLTKMTTYGIRGTTALYDAVGKAVDALETQAKKIRSKKGLNFLVMTITDGAENASRKFNAQTLGELIKKLQATDKWSFTFRVPRGYASHLAHMLNIPSGNVLEWEQTDAGFTQATLSTSRGISSFYQAKQAGVMSTKSFYSDLSGVSSRQVRSALDNISSKVDIFPVTRETKVREFIERRTKTPFVKGTAFYQLTKTEKAVQDYKKIVIRNKQSGEVYGGDNARDILGLPAQGSVRVVPGDHGKFDIFVQSTSVNRKLVPGTEVVLWKSAAK